MRKTLIAIRRYRGDASDRSERCRSNLNVDAVFERYLIGRDAAVPATQLLDKGRKTGIVGEDATQEVENLSRLLGRCRHDWNTPLSPRARTSR